MKKMSPILLTGLIAGWFATALVAGLIAVKFATAAAGVPQAPAPAAAAQPPAPATTQLVTQTTVPPPAATTPMVSTPMASTPMASTPMASTPMASTPMVSTPMAPTPAVPTPAAPTPAAPTPAVPAPAAPPPAVAPAVVPAPAAPARSATMMAATPAAPTGALTVGPAAPIPAQSAIRNPQSAIPAAPTPAAVAPRISYANLTAGPAEQGVRLNLRDVTIDQALNFLTESVGFTINRTTSTMVAGKVDVVSEEPLTKDEIVNLFNKVLASHDLTAVQDNKILTIMTSEDAQKNAGTPVRVDTNPEAIPADARMVTEVIPVHALNPTQIVKDLYTLIPPGALMNTSEAGNSVVMTAPQADVRRFAQIIAALDSTGNGDLEVFLLTYADSKAIAQELKDVFTDTGGGGGGGGGGIAAIFGGGGRGGRGGGGGGASDAERRAAVHVNAVSDDENNAVLVSAPLDFMPGISNLIVKLDIPQEDTVVIKLFHLKNADCTDLANQLLYLFPDPSTSGGAARGGGGRGTATFAGGRGGASTGVSQHLMKQMTVNAVADPRTSSLLVTASKDTMSQIEQIIDEMDASTYGHVQVYVWKPQNGDVLDLAGPLSDLFMQNGRSSSASSQGNALQTRMQNGATSATTTASSSISGSTSTSGR